MTIHTTRVRRATAFLAYLAFFILVPQAVFTQILIFVGTYTVNGSQGIYAFRFDPATGQAESLGLATRSDNPSFLAAHPDGRFLYAVNELNTFQEKLTGAVSVFAVNHASGRLDLVQQVSSQGQGPAHLSLDMSARYLLVANYGSGSVTVFPIEDDGRLGRHTAFVQASGSSVHPTRQAAPHPHAIHATNDNRFVMVPDLGLDKLVVYRIDAQTGALTPDSLTWENLDPGSGPRHMAMTPSGDFVYVVNELTSTITTFAYEPGEGRLERKQTIPSRQPDAVGDNFPAEILVDPGGRHLYVSNRGDNTIAMLDINPADGLLTPVQWVSCGGTWPRHIAISPDGRWLFAANQKSHDVAIFKIDPGNGRLTRTPGSLRVVSPVCVSILAGP